MVSRINNRVTIRNRIMAEVDRRAAGKLSPGKRAAAAKLVEQALALAAERAPIPVAVTLNRKLAMLPQVNGIVKPSKTDILELIRVQVFSLEPGGSIIRQVDQCLVHGKSPDPATLAAAQTAIYRIMLQDLLDREITPHHLAHFEHSHIVALMEAFPHLGLVREDFPKLDWSTPESSVRNIRHHLFKHNPGLQAEVEAAEALLAADRPISAAQAKLANGTRQKILRLAVMENLDGWGLGGYGNCPGFTSLRDLIEQSFPFIKNDVFADFLGDYNCADLDDLRQAYSLLQTRMRRLGPAALFKMKDHQIRAAGNSYFSLTDLLDKFAQVFARRWHIGKYLTRTGATISTEQIFDFFLKFVVYKSAQDEIAADLLAVKKVVSSFNKETVNLNHARIRWLRKFGFEIFPALFGMPFEAYVRSRAFSEAGPKGKNES